MYHTSRRWSCIWVQTCWGWRTQDTVVCVQGKACCPCQRGKSMCIGLSWWWINLIDLQTYVYLQKYSCMCMCVYAFNVYTYTCIIHHTYVYTLVFFFFWSHFSALQVPFARSSLSHDDIFILDTQSKIFQFNGSNSSIQERAKALEVLQYIKDTYHDGKCEIASIGKSNYIVGSSIMTINYHFLSLSQSSCVSCRGWEVDGWCWKWRILGFIWWLCSTSKENSHQWR